MNRCSWKF